MLGCMLMITTTMFSGSSTEIKENIKYGLFDKKVSSCTVKLSHKGDIDYFATVYADSYNKLSMVNYQLYSRSTKELISLAIIMELPIRSWAVVTENHKRIRFNKIRVTKEPSNTAISIYEATKNMLDKINYEVKYTGFDMDNKMLMFECSINGEKFDYSTGIAYAQPIVTGKLFNDHSSVTWTLEKCLKNAYFVQHKEKHSLIKPEKLPELKDVLHCLFLDSEANFMDFESWADEFGLNPDSMKHHEIYKACVDNGRRLLSALKEDYFKIKDIIERDN